MSHRSLLAVGCAGFLTVLLGAAMWLGLLRHHVTPAELDTLFRERIPMGSSSARVEAFLDTAGVEHGNYESGDRDIYATWRRTWVSLVGEGGIQVRFLFDERRRLTGYELQEFSTYL